MSGLAAAVGLAVLCAVAAAWAAVSAALVLGLACEAVRRRRWRR